MLLNAASAEDTSVHEVVHKKTLKSGGENLAGVCGGMPGSTALTNSSQYRASQVLYWDCTVDPWIPKSSTVSVAISKQSGAA